MNEGRSCESFFQRCVGNVLTLDECNDAADPGSNGKVNVGHRDLPFL